MRSGDTRTDGTLYCFCIEYPPLTSYSRTSFFLIGFYTLSLVCIVLILKFGVLPAVNPPSKTLRGMFVLASAIAGIAGGGIAIFFWKASRYCIGAWGGMHLLPSSTLYAFSLRTGFAFALWIQCFHNGGIIKPIGLRWIMYIGVFFPFEAFAL